MLNRISIAVVASLVVLFCATLNRAHAQFQTGEFRTWSMESWGDDLNNSVASQLLVYNFDIVYPLGGFELGVPGPAGHSMAFTSPLELVEYLPAGGLALPLFTDYLDPMSTSSGVFGGLVTALRLNVDFADAGVLSGSAGIPFGDLILSNMHDVQTAFSTRDLRQWTGLTVRQFLTEASILLGGGTYSYSYTIDEAALVTDFLDSAFEDGQPSQLAQNHLRIPRPGDFDKDGDADGADFLKWQRARGGADPMVDANVDGIVDGKDLAIWASSFGAAAAPTLVAVPEPAAWALGAMCLAPFAWRPRTVSPLPRRAITTERLNAPVPLEPQCNTRALA